MHIARNNLRGNLRVAAQRSAEHAFHRQAGFILDEFAGGAGADEVELRQGLPILYGEGDHVGLFAVMSDDCEDRKSTRLNSSHVAISYAVFCLTKEKQNILVVAEP